MKPQEAELVTEISKVFLTFRHQPGFVKETVHFTFKALIITKKALDGE